MKCKTNESVHYSRIQNTCHKNIDLSEIGEVIILKKSWSALARSLNHDSSSSHRLRNNFAWVNCDQIAIMIRWYSYLLLTFMQHYEVRYIMLNKINKRDLKTFSFKESRINSYFKRFLIFTEWQSALRITLVSIKYFSS